MPLFKTNSPQQLYARYTSLIEDVPIALLTALSAIILQMIALEGSVSWKASIGLPAFRLSIGIGLVYYWFLHRHDSPDIQQIRRRLNVASAILILAGIATFFRTQYLFSETAPSDHYFLLFHTTLYGLCFGFILRKIGPAAYLYNALLISTVLLCISNSHFDHQLPLTGLILVFEVGVLLVMKSSNQLFDHLIEARYQTQRLLEENKRLARQDALTRLPNRRQFFEHLDKRLLDARKTGTKFVVGLIDLDDFKPVNDAYGHHCGDLVLVEVGNRLAKMQAHDLAFYRLGGDEFAFLVTETDPITLKSIGQQINSALSAPIHVQKACILIQASIGTSQFNGASDTAQKLYEEADEALYAAKTAGPGNIAVFSQERSQRILLPQT